MMNWQGRKSRFSINYLIPNHEAKKSWSFYDYRDDSHVLNSPTEWHYGKMNLYNLIGVLCTRQVMIEAD